MSRVAGNSTPKYRRHKASGQAVVALSGRDHYLGTYGTRTSKAEYDRLVGEWLMSGRQPAVTNSQEIRIVEVVARYLGYAELFYVSDGKPSKEVQGIKMAVKHLARLYGRTRAREFGPLGLRTVRDAMIKDGRCLSTINSAVGRIKRLFKWAAGHELVPAEVFHGLQAVEGLRRDRTTARNPRIVRPVADHLVDAVLPHVSRQVAAMIKLQRLTGMRSGELVIMRGADLDTSGKNWLYRPAFHKTQHHGHDRIIHIGPAAQEVVRPFLRAELGAYLFSPKEAEAERRSVLRQNRKTRVQPSQADRRKQRPLTKPGDRYEPQSYKRAIYRGCDEAFPPLMPLAQREEETYAEWMARLTPEQKRELKEWRRANRWHPHQLRHNAATRLRKEFGIEAARVVLGHRSAAVTEIYAEVDHAKAAEIMGRVG